MQKNIIQTLWKKLLILLAIVIVIIISVVPLIFQETTLKDATLVAQNTAQQYSSLRSYYTKNIVSKLKNSEGVSISSNYKHKDSAIPLPATMIHELSELSQSSGLQIKLYSAYPFPDRSTRRLDSFQQDAWKNLTSDPNNPYVATITSGDRHLVRVAIADILTEQACVDCHNSHPDTPKTGWKLGDVRGVLEVIVPIDQQLTWQQSGSYQLTVIFILLFISVFAILLHLLNKESKSKVKDIITPLKNQKFAMNAHSLLSMADIRGNITYVNDKFCKISGYSKEELLGKKHSLLNSNNQPKSYWQKMHNTILAGNVWHDEVRNRAKAGHYYWVDTTIVPNYDNDGLVNGFTSIRTDITQQKKDALLLEEAKEQAESAAANFLSAKEQAESAKFALDQHSLVSIAELDGTIIYVNDRFSRISGYTKEELLGKKHNLLNSNNQPKSYWQDMHNTVLAGNTWHDEVRNRAKAGHYYWVDTTIVPNYGKSGQVNGFTSIRTDITQQKEDAKLLELAKEQAESAQEQAESAQEQAESAKFALDQHSLVSVTELDGTITYVNDKFVEISGYNREEIIGKKHNLLNSNNQPKSYWQNMHNTVLAGNTWHDEVRNRAKAGHYYWVDTTIVPNFAADQKVIGFTSIRTDITQQKEDARLLELAKVQAESAKFALDQHSLVSVAELDGTITYVNDKFVEISGYNREEIIGKKHNLLNSNNQPKSYWQNMHNTVLAGNTWHDEVRNRAKSGHYYWVDTTIVPNFDANQKVIGFTSIRTDVTEQRHILDNLAIAKEQAEVASNSKADFLANMSHEIRTPMNGVIGMTNLLLDSQLNDEQNKLANTVKSSAVGLLGIINDILDFSKVEAGKLDLELIPFNLGQMIGDIGTTMSFQSHRKGLQLICPATPIIQQWVTADPGRIRQILTNLIGNSIKFTSQGEVAVYVHLLEKTSEHKLFRFEVRDTGIGISAEQQELLFDKFSQADTSTTRKYGGTGLGLSICKKLVELMGGEIGIDSEIGQGSTFWFTLPLFNAKAVESIPVFNTDIQHEKVLIIDDNETNLELMHQLHNIWNIPHKLINSASAALDELKQASQQSSPYTMAILDMHMPEIDGLELCKLIQQSPQITQPKLIMASSQAQRGDALKMKQAGFQGYITKPIQQSELFDVLLMVSGLKETSPEFVTRHSTKDYAQFKAHVLVVEDNPTNQLVIEGLLRALGLTVDLAGNGAEAVTALQNVSKHDLVFMDCQMPVLDGYQATKKIRSQDTGIINTDIPIIAMTANAMAGDKQKCLDAGMNDYLSKPIEPEKVVNMLKKWLPSNDTKTSKSEVSDNIETELKDESESNIFDYDDMSARLMNDPALMKSVAEIFYQDITEQLEELKVCIDGNDVESSAAIMHKIKGAAANVGGKKVAALALDMEVAGKADNLIGIRENLEQLEHEFNNLKQVMEKML